MDCTAEPGCLLVGQCRSTQIYYSHVFIHLRIQYSFGIWVTLVNGTIQTQLKFHKLNDKTKMNFFY